MRSWLLRIATNLFVDLCRKRKWRGQGNWMRGKRGRQPGRGRGAAAENSELGAMLAEVIAGAPGNRVPRVCAAGAGGVAVQGHCGDRRDRRAETRRYMKRRRRRKLIGELEGRI